MDDEESLEDKERGWKLDLWEVGFCGGKEDEAKSASGHLKPLPQGNVVAGFRPRRI